MYLAGTVSSVGLYCRGEVIIHIYWPRSTFRSPSSFNSVMNREKGDLRSRMEQRERDWVAVYFRVSPPCLACVAHPLGLRRAWPLFVPLPPAQCLSLFHQHSVVPTQVSGGTEIHLCEVWSNSWKRL